MQPEAGSSARPGRGLRRLWITLACLLAGPLVAEGALRLLLFHPNERIAALAAPLREPGLYANPSEDAAYWKLQHVFTSPEQRRIPRFAAGLGWLGHKMVELYRDPGPPPPDDRKLVLLYGSSFAACKTPDEECFEELVAESPQGRTARVLNFGVPGYGIDQVYMLMRETIDRYAETDPLVVISFVIESDLDRAALSFRQRPKPLFRVVDGELLEPSPVLEDIDEFLEREPIGIASYAWNYVLYGTELFSTKARRSLMGSVEKRESKQELCRALLLATRDELEARGLDYFFLFFRDERACTDSSDEGWKATFVHELCEAERIPFIDTRAATIEFAEANDLSLSDLYIQAGHGSGHPNGIGNRALTGSLLRGLSGARDNETLAVRAISGAADRESRFRDEPALGLLDSARAD